MKRLLLAAMILGSMALGACNTFSGMGKDTQETGAFISGQPAHDAYHQMARDY